MNLDPKDWNDFRKEAHRLLDACVDRLETAREHRWQEPTDRLSSTLGGEAPKSGQSFKAVSDSLIDDIMPFATGNTHPQFFGWVHGTGLASGILSEMVAATMNSNCGGRNHGAIMVERAVIDWCKEIFEFPNTASGLVTVGTSQATILALACARMRVFGKDVRIKGVHDFPPVRIYCREGTHSCVVKAMEILGYGQESVVIVSGDDVHDPMPVEALKAQIAEDKAQGFVPLAVVGTAGSVNIGAFDDLDALADLCDVEDLWLHVDGAFGAWAKIADAPWYDLVKGMERADSLAFDFHKWMSVPYDCGAVLVRDKDLHYDTFEMRPAYLADQAQGLASGDLWFCDFGTDLSRGFRALKVWVALQHHGLDAFSDSITGNCKQAAYMAKRVQKSDVLELGAPVISNVCTFRAVSPGMDDEALDQFNAKIVYDLQNNGQGVFSTTVIDGRTVIRAAIVNHRTEMRDIDDVMDNVLAALDNITT